MKTLKECNGLDFEMFFDEHGKRWYRLLQPIFYISHRYKNKTVTCPKGMLSDGASGPATDIVSKAWWVHDRLRDKFKWDDGSYCPNLQASWVLHDILMKENRLIRAWTWFIATLLWGYLVDFFTNRRINSINWPPIKYA